MKRALLRRMAGACATFGMIACVNGAAHAGETVLIEEFQKFTDPEPLAFEFFSSSVSVSGDWLIVSSRTSDDDFVDNGKVHVYRLTDGVWKETQVLFASDPGDHDEFGNYIDISGDLMIIGTWTDDIFTEQTGHVLDQGSAYIFRFDGDQWVEEQMIIPQDPFIFKQFGVEVAIDGDRAIIGAHHDPHACIDDPNPGIVQNCHSGAAYVFEFDGKQWTQTSKIVPSDPALRDLFGSAVDLRGDVVVIGAWNKGNTSGPCPGICNFDGHGAVYVYRLVEGTWIEEQILLPDNPVVGSGDLFGRALSFDGQRILAGSGGDDDVAFSAGAGYIYAHHDESPGIWLLEQKIYPGITASGQGTGEAVAIEGSIAVMGAQGAAPFGQSSGGSAYVYLFDGDAWQFGAQLAASDTEAFDSLGHELDFANGHVVTACAGDDEFAMNNGAAYVFEGFADCNRNGVLDAVEIQQGRATDRDGDFVPDECASQSSPDLDGDGAVGPGDLAIVLGNWGLCPKQDTCPADLSGDGVVGPADLAIVLGHWG